MSFFQLLTNGIHVGNTIRTGDKMFADQYPREMEISRWK